MWTESEITDIATDAASDVAADTGSVDYEDRITALEEENGQLRDEVDSHERMIQELYDNQRATADYINDMR